MKLLLYIGALSFVVFTFWQANTLVFNSESKEELMSVFESGSSRELAKFFDQGVEININGNQGDYSKNQAELVMRDFFKKFPPQEFKLLHEGNNAEQIVYYIGMYRSDDTSFRVFIRGKKDSSSLRFYSLDIVRS